MRELIVVANKAVRSLTRYRHTWLGIFEPEQPGCMRILEASEAIAELVYEEAPVVPIDGDPMMIELLRQEGAVVVVDARTDPRTNKSIVERLQNRTIINVPMRLGLTVVGTLGIGTFGDEGVVEPTQAELDALVVFGVQLAATLNRLADDERQQREARERVAIERRLEALQRVELMGVLLSGVAHDLNNLLSVVQSNLEMLKLGPDPEALLDAQLAVERAAQVCLQLLTLGRAQASTRQPIDLNERVEATLRLVRPAIPRGIEVSHEPHPHPLVFGDPVQLDQVLANLILNARDAVGAKGQICVEVNDATISPPHAAWARSGHFARVCVRDSGTGIPPGIIERIFDPLFTTKSSGTGLGLAVVSRVVAAHQGLMHCESQPGNTSFELYLPEAHN